jgi:TonB family protein
MRLPWFFIASLACHGALALIHYSPAETIEQIAPLQLYIETNGIPKPEAMLSPRLTKNRSQQIKPVIKTRLPDQPQISGSEPYWKSLRQVAEDVSEPATPLETDGEKDATPAPPVRYVRETVTQASTGEAGTVPVVTAGPAGVNAPGQEEPATQIFSEQSILSIEKPVYPERAKREGWEGTVLLEVLIDSQGRPERIAINRSSGFADLDRAAREAVKSWRFRPAFMGERRITSTARVPIVFRLDAKN